MAAETTGRKSKSQKVTFSIEAPKAQQVVLMGDFNNWNPETHPMKKYGNGIWKKMVTLPPHQYEYKFLIDGEWKEDPKNDQICQNCFGTRNNVLNLTG